MADPDGRLSPACLDDLEDESLDPRIQGELERLNKASEEINKLELELDDARAGFRQALSDSTQKLNILAKKLGTCVDKARPYYDARMKAKEAHIDSQKAALRFERACSMHEAAKEMVQLAEQGYMCREQPSDPAWQEMLNHATMKVNEAEKERMESETDHRKTMIGFQDAEGRVQYLQRELKRAIAKSNLASRRSFLQMGDLVNQYNLCLLPYFEMKAKFNQTMEDQKRNISILEEDVSSAKTMYSEALRNLESISDEIHQQRIEKRRNEELGVRGAGVGSETPSPPPCRDHHTNEGHSEGMGSAHTYNPSSSQGFIPPSVIHASPDKSRTQSYRSAIDNRTDDGDPDFPVPSLESEYKALPDTRAFNEISRRSLPVVGTFGAYGRQDGQEESVDVFGSPPRDRTQSLRQHSTSPREELYNDLKYRSASLTESQYSTPSSGSPTRNRRKLQAGGLILKIDQAMDPLSGMYDTTQMKPTRLSQKSLTEKLSAGYDKSRGHDSDSVASTPGSRSGADFTSLNIPSTDRDDSDSESVVSTGPMLDDDQVGFLTMEFTDKANLTDVDNHDKGKDWGSMTLPPKLSHLEHYIHRRESESKPDNDGTVEKEVWTECIKDNQEQMSEPEESESAVVTPT
ncbi:hypothetical protein FSP39_006891 [Pinctada imbricata]|uniref:SH3 domain-binding protein 5-like n=1 Tax=Pinctada imbricata TaxID=66713 RepID=A0AA88YS63_PINIB|nr:hypothetical protein FSP39_006891 [Pinctada imbricata]